MSRSKKLYLLLGILAAACVVTFCVSRYQEYREDIRTSDEIVLEVDPDTVSALSWEYDGNSLAFHKGESWIYDGDEAFPVDQEMIQERLELFEAFGVRFTIEAPEDLGQYGLDDPPVHHLPHCRGGDLHHYPGGLQHHGRAALCLRRGRERLPGGQ